jgi:hypothetical protein
LGKSLREGKIIFGKLRGRQKYNIKMDLIELQWEKLD